MDQQVPKWLLGFLEPANVKQHDHYFAECTGHIHHNPKSSATEQNATKKVDKNYFCVDCITGPVCETTCKVDHKGHRVLQVRKASQTYSVRVSDIARLVNIDYVQNYVINGRKIVFLPSRPQRKPVKGSPNYCDGCRRSLQDKPARFCSLSCKVKLIESSPRDVSVTLFRFGEEQSGMSGDAGRDLTASPSPATPPTKRARTSSEKLAPVALMGPPHQPFDKVDSAQDDPSPTSVMHHPPDHEPDAVSPDSEPSSSQDSLETRYIKLFRSQGRNIVRFGLMGLIG